MRTALANSRSPAVLALLAMLAAASASHAADLDSLSWMAGRWQSVQGPMSMEEVWLEPGAG